MGPQEVRPFQPKDLGRPVVLACIIGAVALLVAYFIRDPALGGLYPSCPLHTLTGLQCPGCGSQQALHDLLHARPVEAFRHNALFVLAPVLIGLHMLIVRRMRRRSEPTWRALLTGWSIVIIAWSIGRNLVTAP